MKSPPHSAAAPKPGKIRLDVLLVERSLAPSAARAQALVLAGKIHVEGQRVDKAGTLIPQNARIEIIGPPQRYASRGGLKLEGALQDFGMTPRSKICLDIGSSTGGFTDCLLQHGATKVYAVDVTISQLDWTLRQNKQVVIVERNARFLEPNDIPEPVDFIVMDVSFISATKILPSLPPVAAPGANFLILIKPQFELAKREIGAGGIVGDQALREKAIERVVTAVAQLGLQILDVKPSRLRGAEGNQEFFLRACNRKLE